MVRGTLPSVHDGPPVTQWARVRDDGSYGLRRGAWCRVVAVTADEATLDAGGRHVTVPRSALIVSSARPERWSIVTLPEGAVNVPPQWGQHYAVCPACSHRAAVGPPPTALKRCSRCGEAFSLPEELV